MNNEEKIVKAAQGRGMNFHAKGVMLGINSTKPVILEKYKKNTYNSVVKVSSSAGKSFNLTDIIKEVRTKD